MAYDARPGGGVGTRRPWDSDRGRCPVTQYMMALDQGTTSSRAVIVDRSGQLVALSQQEFPQHLPAPGEVEHDPEEIWDSQLAVARQVLQDAKIDAAQLAAVGITNQRETVVLWERDSGRPVGPAIVWQSRVSAAVCEQIREQGHESLLRERTGLILDPYFSASKLTYLLQRDSQLRARAERGEVLFGTVDSYLIWRLTGGRCHVTDVTNASRTMLLDIRTLQWDDELLRIFGVPRAMLPEVAPSSQVYGSLDPQWLGAETPVAGAAGDQQAATFGQCCFQPGDVKNTYGTGGFLLMNTGQSAVVSSNRLLTTVAWQLGDQPPQYALEGAVFVSGAVVQWLRDGLGLIDDAAEVERRAAEVDDTAGLVLVPAFVGLGAPHWDPYARGALLGITRGATAAHLCRAALESMAQQTADVIDAMRADAELPLSGLKVDGGAANNNLLLQIQADLLDTTVRRPVVAETTALGAAYLAGLAVGYWKDPSDVANNWRLDREFHSQMAAERRASLRQAWEAAVARSLQWEKP